MNNCYNCGNELSGTVCERCQTVQRFRYSGLVIIGPAVLALLLVTSGCLAKKHGLRIHRNVIAQKVIQYEHCDPKRAHVNAVCRHFSERPKSHRPFND